MKLLPTITPKPTKRVDTREPLGHGFDAAFVVLIFFGLGWGIDSVAGTTPLFMILMTLFGAVGVFLRFWYQYDARMTELEDERRRKAASRAGTSGRP